jgi:copper(I)-binding protein
MRLATTVFMVSLFAACSVEHVPLVASDVLITKPLPGTQMTAGYFTLSNNTTQEIKITHVTSPEFESVEMHESVLEDGIVRMYALADLTILAGETVRFEPGGKHLMLMRPIGENDFVMLEFRAGKAIVLTVNAALTE